MVLAFRRCGEDWAALTAERALDLGAGEKCRRLRVSTDHGQPVDHARHSSPIDDFRARAAIPAGNLHERVVKGVSKAKAAPEMTVWSNSEIHQRHRAEFAADFTDRLHVIGHRFGDKACGDFTRCVKETFRPWARPEILDLGIEPANG